MGKPEYNRSKLSEGWWGSWKISPVNSTLLSRHHTGEYQRRQVKKADAAAGGADFVILN